MPSRETSPSIAGWVERAGVPFRWGPPAPTLWNIWPGPSNSRNTASGFLKMSRGPRNPAIERFTHMIAASVEIAADDPFESESCLPARIARNGMWCATNMPIALSICSAVAPTIAPNVAAEPIAPCTTWSIFTSSD